MNSIGNVLTEMCSYEKNGNRSILNENDKNSGLIFGTLYLPTKSLTY